jgi:predicted component of type VI protein secretion system
MTWLEFNDALRELPNGDVIIGGGSQATWRLPQLDLRPRHFVIESANGKARLRPFSSDSVVALNGKQVASEPCELHDGDTIEAGAGTFWFRVTPNKQGKPREESGVAHLVDVSHGKAYSLARTTTLIGRDPHNTIVLMDPTVSRFHAELRREAGGVALHAMGSTGTAVNGRHVAVPYLLEEGDEVSIAGSMFRFTRAALPTGLKEVSADEVVPEDLEVARRRTIRVKSLTPSTVAGGVKSEASTGASPFLIVVGVLIAIVVVAMLVLLGHRD